VLPTSFDFADIEKYYTFFEYTYVYADTVVGGVVDFENDKTTIPFNTTTTELNSDNGISSHLFLDTLYQSLSLINQ
jgi:hypothetical protein